MTVPVSIPTDRIVHWLSQLVQIPSINPEGVESGINPDWLGEAKMAAFLQKAFTELGGEVEIEDVLPNRPNVYAKWSGASDQWAVLDVHTDTVGVAQMTDPPFDGRVEDGRVWGRGAVDTKASLALVLALLEVVQSQGLTLKHNLLVLASMSEEFGGYGAKAFNDWALAQELDIVQLLVAEPTMCTPIYAHKGLFAMRLRIEGVAAHSSQPHLGKNAITATASVVQAIEKEHARLQAQEAKTAVGNGTIAVTLIEGGSGHNVIPASCTIHINRRLAPFENPEDEIARVLKLAQEASPLPIKVELSNGLPAFYQDPDSPWIKEISSWTGQEPSYAPYGTNALGYPEIGQEMVIFGPGSIDQAHGAVEWVEVAELVKAGDVYTRWLLA